MAQVKEKPLQITVVANNSSITVFPEDNYLFQGSRNRIKIIMKSGQISKVTLMGGTITGTDSMYIAEVNGSDKALLSVYEKTSGGKEKLVFNKEYRIVPYPMANFNGVRNDSVIDKLSLMGGFLKANQSLGPGVKITSFKMLIEKDGKFALDSIQGNRLSKEMRLYINRMRNGSVALIEEIKYTDPYGEEKTIPALRLFVVEAEKPTGFGL
jgi:hypothetical protein